MPHVVRAQGQVCAQNPTTANPTRQPWFSNGSNPFQNAPHPYQDAPRPPPERPNLTGKFLGRLLCCCAAVQRGGTRSPPRVYFSSGSGSCETVQANGALCPYVRLVPGAR